MNKTYKIQLGDSFARKFESGVMVPTSYHAMLVDGPELIKFHQHSDPTMWKHYVKTDDNVSGYFCWEEVEGVFKFGLYRPNCPFHHGKPWWWSSNHTWLDHYAGVKTANCNLGNFAVLSHLAQPPQGYHWDKHFSFLVPDGGQDD